MAHKKSLLRKFLSDPEDTDDTQVSRSPFYNGQTWVIPETSTSEGEVESKNDGKLNKQVRKTSSENQPSTSTHHQQKDDNYSSKSPIFKADNSSLIPPTPATVNQIKYYLENATSSYQRTLQIMGTSLNPI